MPIIKPDAKTTALHVLKWILIVMYVVLPFVFFMILRSGEILSLYHHFTSTPANSLHSKLTLGTTIIVIMISIVVRFGAQPRSILIFVILLMAAFRYLADVSSYILWDPESSMKLASADTSASSALTGTIALVTGANKGIGLMTATMLAEFGAHVVVTCRTVARCHDAVQTINQAAKDRQSGGFAQAMSLDLDSLQSVYDLVQALNSDAKVSRTGIRLLYNNAGTSPFGHTIEDLEAGFGGMHLAHMALTLGVLPLLEKSGQKQANGAFRPARVVMTSSEAMMESVDNMFGETFAPSFMEHDGEGDLRGETTLGAEDTYLSSDNMHAYSRAKLCNVLFAFELNRRMHNKAKLASSLPTVVAHALHPGGVSTPSTVKGCNSVFGAFPGISFLAKYIYVPLYLRSPRSAARIMLFAGLAEQPDVMTRGGCYIDALGRPVVSSLDRNVTMASYETLLMADQNYSARLWDVSLRLIRESPAKTFAKPL